MLTTGLLFFPSIHLRICSCYCGDSELSVLLRSESNIPSRGVHAPPVMKVCIEERLREIKGTGSISVPWPRALMRNCELSDFESLTELNS